MYLHAVLLNLGHPRFLLAVFTHVKTNPTLLWSPEGCDTDHRELAITFLM